MSPLISTGQLRSMRTLANRSMSGTAVIHRPTLLGDGQGGSTQTFTPAGTVSCNLAPVTRRTGDEQVVANRLETATQWYLTTPALTDIRSADRVIVDAGGTFEVAGVREPRPVEIVRRAIVTLIT